MIGEFFSDLISRERERIYSLSSSQRRVEGGGNPASQSVQRTIEINDCDWSNEQSGHIDHLTPRDQHGRPKR